MVQGLSVGGEYTGSITFLVEHADPARRGLVGSWSTFGSGLGSLLGLLTGTAVTGTLSPAAVQAWGWRVPFLLGVVLGCVGLYLRLGVAETPQFEARQKAGDLPRFPLGEALRHHRRALLTVLGLVCLPNVAFYLVFVYMTTYLSKVVRIPLDIALATNALGTVLGISLVPLTGALSDRIGRKPPQLAAGVGLLILCYPLFLLMVRGGLAGCILAQCVFSVLLGVLTGPVSTLLVELFTARARYTALSVGYNVALAVYGGGTPLLATWLIQQTGDPLSPAFVLMAAAALSLGVLLAVRETYREPLR
jgi:MHS family proline/betaine transporter-like MFS transporter